MLLAQRVVTDRAVLAARLKDLTAKQTFPIEPLYQARFNELLLEAAAGSEALQKRRHDVQWAAELAEPPSSWEQRLHALAACVQELQGLHQQLRARSDAMSSFAATPLV